ncbi:MAG: transketolase [Candidatus Lindowbacteria bacterium RIFCSPLOWO2_12_FULL_62_27]|nr:MAG: transketolase [Candidatus Lindowbacteria bacterium RIFCSPLOWO2_02_FULL_62_12]OGH59308.1 MAG: transketolase [Candidatus Lindowbacteria bacterium RIFCSPLOWO2_12_FULL_62_27]
MDAVQKANSGHPGTPMALAPVAHVLYDRYLRFNPKNPNWPNRDRFILSAGHASMLLYSTLHINGFDLPLNELKNFRQWNSKAPGHPEYGMTPGVETTTGPLGQGVANSVGFAMAQKWLAAHFNRPGHDIVDYRIFAVCGDGCMMEGVSGEAASIAGHLGLDNLVWIYDNNHITIEGNTALAFTEDVAARFMAYHWNVQRVGDANDLDLLTNAFGTALKETGRPTLIIVDSHIAYGAPNKQDTSGAHGEPLGEEEIKLTKQRYGWPADKQFWVPDEVAARMNTMADRGQKLESEWNQKFEAYRKAHPDLAEEFLRMQKGDLPPDWDKDLPTYPADPKGVAGRDSSSKTLAAIAKRVPYLVGGSADLTPSTKTRIPDGGDFQKGSYAGRNLHFGIREHGMGSILNGMALSKLRVYGSGFLIFSDYCRPTLRLAGLMEIPVLHIFTHDSIGVGEDGPTHQPIEHLVSLRAIPHLVVIRPCDANETVEAWRWIMKNRTHPVALILSRQALPTLDRTKFAPASGLHKGAYILADGGGAPQVILMSTGSEVQFCMEAHEKLKAEGIRSRVVSFPSYEIFEMQSEDYRNEVLPPACRKRVAVEAASTLGWRRYVGIYTDGAVIGRKEFGASAPLKELLKQFGFTADHVAAEAKALLKG